MSSRALRRLQKEQIVDTHSDEEEQEEEEEYVEEKPVKKMNLFDLLNDGDDDVVEEEEEEEEEEPEPEPVVVKKPEPVVEKTSNKKNKKKNKKNKKKSSNEPVNEVEDISMKELDKVLKELGQQSSEIETANKPIINNQLLAVNYRYLDAEAEMKRLFGSHVVNSERQGRILKKSKFSTPKADWPPYKRNGLSMELVETKDGVSYFAFRHSEQYQDAQVEFLNAVATHNPEALLFLTRKHPYHIDSLLQLSEIAKHSGDWSAAGDFIERALYACERALHPQFSPSSGTARLSYKRSENRPFFLAIFRHIQFLTRRGCWRTAFEFNKFLFSLDPISDPLGALLSLDYHALSSRDYEYVLKFHSEWKTDGQLYPIEMTNIPSMAYSAAYAKFKTSKNPDESAKLIKEAIKKYPLIYCRLLEKLGEPEAPQVVQLTQYIPNEYMEIMQLSYIERTHEMWKEPEVLEWLKKNGSNVIDYPVSHPEVIQQKLACKEKDAVPLNICRYIVLIDIRQLMSYLPSSVTSHSYQTHDPLPPEDSETMYDLDSRLSSNGGLMNMLESLMNRANNQLPVHEHQVGQLMNMLGNFLGRAGNQIPAQNQQELRQLLEELEEVRNRNANQAPGAFPGDDDEEEDYPDLEPQEETTQEGITQEEVNEIMNAIGDDEDLEVQRALAEAFERRNN